MPSLTLELLPGLFTVHQLAPDAPIPPLPSTSTFSTVSRSKSELSILCPAEHHIASERSMDGFVCLRIAGTLDFNLIGILAELTHHLAKASVSVFAVSTFDTDYLLFQDEQRDDACAALKAAGYSFTYAP